MNRNQTEFEATGLCICIEAINDIANHALLELRNSSRLPLEYEVYFHTNIHRNLFLIRLLDFVSVKGNKDLTGVEGTCIDILKSACNTKSFNINGSINHLNKAVEEFDNWLKYKKTISIWLPTLNINANIEVSRLEFL